jgi:hypothetical protein
MTKRVLTALCVFFFILLCGCGTTGKSAVTDFAADFTADYRELELSGKISADRRGIVNIEIKTPDTLNGIKIVYKNGETELKRDSLSCTADEAYIPETGFPSLLKSALTAFVNAVINENAKPDNGSMALEKDGRRFEYITDENGYITKITSKGLSVDFCNISKTE